MNYIGCNFPYNYASGLSMLVALMGRYSHIVQSQHVLQLTYIDIDPNQSTFHEDRTIKLRMISSQVKVIMTVQNTNFQLAKVSVQSQMQVLMINMS